MTMRTYREQHRAFGIDNVSGIVYSTDQLSRPQQGRQVYLSEYSHIAKPHSHSAVNYLFQKWLKGADIPFTQRCVKNSEGTQTRLRKGNSLRRMHTNLRKGCVKDN